jgi:predicted 3-demethylubiquinone-9 3-methyltransferase (glyoxalase superfamily)
MNEMLVGTDNDRTACVTKAFLKMKKFDIEALKRAYEGG